MKHKTKIAVPFAVALIPAFGVLLSSCSSCSRGEDIDTFDEFVGGPTTPCATAPLTDEVCVEGGKFLMGCMEQDTECEEIEKPVHVVQLSPFFIDRKETTWAPFIDFLNTLRDGYIRLPGSVQTDTEPPELVWGNPVNATIDGEDILMFPVHLDGSGDYAWGVPDDQIALYFDHTESWASTLTSNSSAAGLGKYGARLYCESLGKRLPTEAQWEYAAREQAKTIYPGQCGDEMHCTWAEYSMCGNVDGCSDTYTDGACAPMADISWNVCVSPWGVERMAGNASEWVEDEFVGDYSACADGCVDPAPTTGGEPLTKGGSIRDPARDLRISARFIFDNGYAYYPQAGIRCARDDAPYDPPVIDAGTDVGK
jgi:formylglycine-generating enzyme required for sulfatase activity